MTSQPASDQQPEETQRTEPASCERHGSFLQRVIHVFGGHDIRSSCPTCSEEARAQLKAQEREQRQREREWRIAELRNASGIPVRYEAMTLGSYVARERGQRLAVAVCQRFADAWPAQYEHGRSLVFVGGPGTGKTHLACAIGSAVIESHLATVRFATAAGMLREIRSTYRRGSERSEADAMEEFTRCDLLILDEIGAQLGSEYEKTVMFEVVNERYQQVLPTILVSNLTAEDLEVYLGQRVMDRLRETGVIVAFGWDSYRGKAAA